MVSTKALRTNNKGNVAVSQPRNLWHILTDPHPSITDIEIRRQSRLLSAITLTIIVMSGLASVLLIARNGGITDITYPLWVGIALTLGWYFANRRGYYRLSSIAVVIQNFILVFGNPLYSGTLEWLFFAILNLMLGALLLPGRGTVILFAVSLAAQFAMLAFKPITSTMTNFASTLVYLVTAPLILVFMYHRSRLETERQAELREANARLRESEVVLERRVDERTADLKVAKEQAEAARERAEKADQIKSQFLASMSHELRTPLNSILTFTQLVGMGTFGAVNDEQKDYLDKSLSSGRHLLALINDVLDVTKIQSGMMKLFIENDFNPATELREIASVAEKLLADKPVKLIADIDPTLPTLTCDKRRMRQVLLNLISNAVKFTESGSVTLSAKARPDSILLAVIDTGPGIAPEDHETIFDPFVQTETGIRHGGGSGLGLPISKSLVKAHGGKLWLESKPGEGTAFYVSIPLQPGLALGEQEI